ncbi:Prephenate dehydrogenase [Kribbella flavida DSM 17836]|uniref:Prephenate dehydrogenase n=1 Tax=Kribbella flavida (strain DSM 17836 / JCM 10339 / NBRC 14399) TaxID=479435 RepID=D2Q4I2_KRIFD|nr:prephenate dehydrogenase [Kribbella flavida]ADB32296.1 Prephenate dehydrogenase [Kribbella flavida DSM 17836]
MTELRGPVRIVGTGLIGTSIGLALARLGVVVEVVDADPDNALMAERIGAGTRLVQLEPQLVVVAVPPDHVGAVITEQLEQTDAVVTDAASVKGKPLADAKALTAASGRTADLARYVGSHPMAGSERNGPLAGRADLFEGATWAITPHETSDPDATELVRRLAEACGARTVELSVPDHDLAVARVSHLPQLMSSLAAGTLVDAPAEHLELSGQGVRDVTRIAAGDPGLWTQIVAANSPALSGLLEQIRDELDRLLIALSKEETDDEVTAVLRRGVSGAVRVPGKHGTPHIELVTVLVTIPDRPGQLARLFADAAASGANVEDLRIDHSPGRPVGEVELAVKPASVDQLVEVLTERGWVVHR